MHVVQKNAARRPVGDKLCTHSACFVPNDTSLEFKPGLFAKVDIFTVQVQGARRLVEAIQQFHSDQKEIEVG